MLSAAQRSALFLLFCIFVVVCVVLEGYLFYSMVKTGFDGGKAVSAILNGGVLYGCGRLFLEMVSRNFLKLSILSPGRLHRFSSERSSTIENGLRANEDMYQTRRNLVTNTLKLGEECLRGWVPGSHFELCVFVDRLQPLLFAYFDSNQNTTSRSMSEREHNPRFYVEKDYEVTRLLQRPTSRPRVLRNTLDKQAKYVFTSNEQRKQVRSTILISLDFNRPCALVVSSNEKNAFSENESDVLSFIKYIGECARFDLIEGDFIGQIRLFKPDLFEAEKGQRSTQI